MFLASSTIALIVASTVTASNTFARLSRHHNLARAAPQGWATGYLEDYDVYHKRYLALDCENKHNTTYFTACCHPLLSTESLSKNRPAYCAPGASSVVSTALPTSTPSDEGDEDPDCEDESGSTDEDEDDSDEDCDEEDDGDDAGSSTVLARSSSTHTSTTHTNPKLTASTAAAKETTTAETSTKISSSTSDNAFVLGGFGTWFTQNGVAGACGKVHKDTEFVVALPTKAYEKGANCGRKVLIYDITNGKSAEAVVADECPTCDNTSCLDMSVGLFKEFATLNVGEFSMKYQYLD